MSESIAPVWEPVSKPLSEYTLPAPCCQRAHEQGYRRGYRDGYTYALYDLAKACTIPSAIGLAVERFREQILLPWVHRAFGRDLARIPKENGPRWRRETRRPRKDAA